MKILNRILKVIIGIIATIIFTIMYVFFTLLLFMLNAILYAILCEMIFQIENWKYLVGLEFFCILCGYFMAKLISDFEIYRDKKVSLSFKVILYVMIFSVICFKLLGNLSNWLITTIIVTGTIGYSLFKYLK